MYNVLIKVKDGDSAMILSQYELKLKDEWLLSIELNSFLYTKRI